MDLHLPLTPSHMHYEAHPIFLEIFWNLLPLLFEGTESKEGRSGCAKHSPEQLPHIDHTGHGYLRSENSRRTTTWYGSTQTPALLKQHSYFPPIFTPDLLTQHCAACDSGTPVAMATQAGSPLKSFSMAQRRPGSFCSSHQRGCPDLEGLP